MIISKTKITPARETSIAISSRPDLDKRIYAVLTRIPIPAVFKINVISNTSSYISNKTAARPAIIHNEE